MKIASYIGKPIRVDRATEFGERGKYARVCVEVDFTKPLLSQFKIEGEEYLVQYEGLKNLCTDCGRYGKPTEQCDCKDMNNEETQATPDTVPETQPASRTKGYVYGEWMIV
ncbi:unnamed protein product [Linum trigynum]|uniref:Uncharacterized protein n=1 Tax=Linum trigynum TaxID=586398 RepID=A0AAV2E0Y5_9ROSI